MMTDYIQKTLSGTTYWERLHGDVQSDSPIVVTMHWLTGTAQAIDFLLADIKRPVREIALQGSYPSEHEAGGYSWFPQGLEFYDKLSDAEQAPLIRAETEKVAAFLAALKQKYAGKIIVTGFSQGGDLSLHLAVYHSELVDLAIPCAGRLSEPMRPEAFQPSAKIRLEQGAADEIVTLESARDVLAWLKQVGFDAELSDYAGVQHDFSAEMIANIQSEIINL